MPHDHIGDLTRHMAKVFMSRYLGVRSPTAGQLDFLMANETEVLYAGTASSGKSTAVLMAGLVNAELPGYSALIVVPELANSALVAMAREWLGQKKDARWDAGSRLWRFPSGASLSIVHRRASISGGYQFIGVDDVARLEREEYLRLLARLRPADALSLQPMLRAAGSPDEPGREWVAQRFHLRGGEDDAPAQGRRVVRACFEDEGLNVDADRVRGGLCELPEPQRTWLLLGDWGRETGGCSESDPERPSAPAVTADDWVERPRVQVGTGEPGGGEVWFDPYQPGVELPNPHVLIDGESGNGKTQTVMLLAASLMKHQVCPLIIDPKDDFLGWAEDQGMPVIDPAAGDLLPFNPLAPVVDHRSGQADTLRHLYLVGDLVMRVWGLGDQQVARLREAMKTAYSAHGVQVGRFRPDGRRYPTFNELREYLDPEDTARTRLSPLFDLDPFAADDGGFAEMLEGGTVVRLTQLPGSEFKTAMAEFLLLALYDHLVRQGHKRGLRRLVVMDEGWRLAMCPFLEPLLREGRAYGLGVVLASQYPDDMPSAVKGATHTQIHFGQGQAGQATAVRREVLGDARGRQAQQLEDLVRGLPTFHAVLRNRQHTPWQEIRVTPYFERQGDR